MSLNPWALAIRPKTLPAALSPVVIGACMAFGDGVGHVPSVVAAAVGALTIQIATNLVNDYCDFKKGADTPERLGPVRVTQAGLIKPEEVLRAAVLFFLIAAIACVFLVQRAGLAILVIGFFSILSGIFYTAGKKSLGYLGLGDIFVFVFFGPVAVGGTYFVQSLEINWAVTIAGLAPGFWSMAILAVNNLRDIDTDRKAGKLTLAVRFGRSFACQEYIFCIMAAALVPFAVALTAIDHKTVIMASVCSFLALPLAKTVCTSVEGPALNEVLARTGQLLLLYSIVFSSGWLLCSR